MLKRVVSTLLAICMVLTTLPVAALALDPSGVAEITAAGGDLASGSYRLNGNVTLERRLIIRTGVNATIDLNGYTLAYSSSGFPANYPDADKTIEAIRVEAGASLTITDTSVRQSGTISFVYTGASQGTTRAVNTITNKGTLMVNGGRIENLTSIGDSQCGYAIDNRPDGDESVYCIINNGTVYAAREDLNYCAIRQFARSEIGTVDLIINGGNVGMLWLQNSNDAVDVNAKTVIENGMVAHVYLEASNRFEVAINGGTVGTVSYIGTGADTSRYPQNIIHGGTIGQMDVGSTGLPGNAMLADDSGMVADGNGNVFTPTFKVEYYESQNDAWNAGIPGAEPYTLNVMFDQAVPAGYYLWFQITGRNNYGIASGETNGVNQRYAMSFLNKGQWESWPSESVLAGAPAAGTYDVTVWVSKEVLDQTNFSTAGTAIGSATVEIGEAACVISYLNDQGALRSDVTVAAGSTISLELGKDGVWNDGTTDYTYSPVVLTVNDALTLTNPSMPGYAFAGWNVTNSGAGYVFTATWDQIDYAVTFDANGGEGEMNPQYFMAGIAQDLTANAFTKAGHAFIGWNTAANGSGTAYADAQELTFADEDNSIILYAQWSTNTYPFTYVKFMGTGAEPVQTQMNITYGVEVTVDLDGGTYYGKTGTYTGVVTADEGSRILTDEAEKSGCTFKGWQYSADTKTFKAMWSRDAYTVTFIVDGVVVNTVDVNALDEIKLSEYVPSKEGAEFTGWYYDEATTQSCGTVLVVEENTELYAGWTTNGYLVTFDAAGGELPQGFEGTQTFEHGATLTLPEPTRKGYTFKNWKFDTIEVNAGASITVVQELVWVAQWEEVQTPINLDANGGQFEGGSDLYSMSAKAYYSTGSVDDLPEPTRKGYTFAGWSLNGSKSTDYRPGGTIVWGDVIDAGATLYAVWKTDKYTVTFNYNDASMPNKEVNVYYGKAVAEPETPSREGFTFGGWYQDGIGNYDFTQPVSGDMTLYASWTEITSTITLNANGGVFADADDAEIYTMSKSYLESNAVNDLPNPTREGYTFIGWSLNGGNSANYKSGETVAWGDVIDAGATLYAVWKLNSYTVTFNYNDASTPNDEVEVYYGQTVEEPEAPTRKGFIFGGWYQDGVGGYYDFTQPVSGDMTLYASWTEITSSIVLNANGGVFADADDAEIYTMNKSYLESNAVNDLQNPTRKGYTFVGWSFDGGKKTAYKPGGTIVWGDVIDAGATLYVVWKTDKYTVTFNYNDASMPNDEVSVYYGKAVAEPETPSREGFTFGGWYQDGVDGYYDFTQPVSGDMTLYASWTEITSTITLNANGGVFADANDAEVYTMSKSYLESNAVNDLQNPTRKGYTFVGWSFDGGKKTAYKPGGTIVWGDVIDAGATLYAVWKTDSYTVTFHYNDASDSDYEVSVVYGKTVAEPAEPTREGYIFNGWYVDDTAVVYDFTWPVERDFELNAGWTPIEYTVTFESNGGSAVAPMTKVYGESFAAPEPPTKEGMTFVGWFKNPECTDEWNFDKDFVTGDITLYARWTNTEYTVTFHANGGHAGDMSKKFTKVVSYGYMLDMTQNTVFTRDGYEFLGWSSMENGTLEIDASKKVLEVNADLDLYAVWAETVDFGTIEVGETPTIARTYDSEIVNASSSTVFFTALDDENGSKILVCPQGSLAPSASTYEDQLMVQTANGYTYYLNLSVVVIPSDMEISTNADTVEYYTVGDTFTVTVLAAPDQDLELKYKSANSALKLVQSLTEGADGTYTAVYEVKSITANQIKPVFTVTNKTFGTAASCQETLELRKEVVVTVKNADGTLPAISSMELKDNADSSRSIAFTYDEAAQAYVALADRSGWDYITFTTADGRQVKLTNTTKFGQTVSDAINETNDGIVYVDYTFGSYTIVGSLYLNDAPVSGVTLSVKGNYGDSFTPAMLYNQATPAIRERYPDAIQDAYNFAMTDTNGKEILIHTFGEDTVDWGTENTIYVNVYATVGYYVAFDRADGSTDSILETQYVKHGALATQPADPVLNGFGFTGWYTDAACTARYDFTTPVEKSITLYAGWTRDAYVVTFHTGYGDAYGADTPQAPQTVAYEGTVTKPADPERPGYAFEGWYTDDTYTDLWDFANDKVVGKMTLYAKWTAVKYQLTYHLNSTVVTNADDFAAQDIYYEDQVVKPVDPITAGFNFQGWYRDNTYTVPAEFPITVTGNVDLYAKWSIKEYVVSFNANGGYMTVDAITVKHGETGGDQWPANPVCMGYTFEGWYLDANGNGVLEEDELAALVDSTTPVRSDMALIARWTQDEYTVTFDAAGGTVNPDSQTVHYGETITEPEIVYGGEDTYLFAGWYTDNTFTTLWNFEDGVTGDMMLVAKWDKAYTVTLDLNGGVMPDGSEGPIEIVVAEGDLIPVPENPSRGAYVLAGWFTDTNKWDTAWNFEKDVVNDNLTLTAGWAHAAGSGTFFDTTATQTFVRIQVADVNGNLLPATGIADLKLSAIDENGSVIFENVKMTEMTNVPADWDKNYAYYTASYDRLTKKGVFQLTAEGYVFNVIAG